MFRLAGWVDKNALENDLYMYLSSAISKTILDCLDRFSSEEYFNFFFIRSFEDNFFHELSQYIKSMSSSPIYKDEDVQVGYAFTQAKMERMKEKMLDPKNFYTFDIFEERILYDMCDYMKLLEKEIFSKKEKTALKEKRKAAEETLIEAFQLSKKKAKDYSKKMYYASAMLLKEDEYENLIFWDDDYLFFWRDGFLAGLEYSKSFVGEMRGYGYHYTCEMFSDIGMTPPLSLLGTEEGNKIATQVQGEQYAQALDYLAQNINLLSPEHLKDQHEEHSDKNKGEDNGEDKGEDLPFN